MARPIPVAFLDGSALARGRALLSGGEMGAGPPVQLRHVGVQTDEDPWIAVTGGERAAQLETTLRDVLAEAEAMAEQIEEKDAQVHQLEARLRALEVRSATPPPGPAASCCASGSFGRLGEERCRFAVAPAPAPTVASLPHAHGGGYVVVKGPDGTLGVYMESWGTFARRFSLQVGHLPSGFVQCRVRTLTEVARRWEEYKLQQPVPLRISDPGGWPTA